MTILLTLFAVITLVMPGHRVCVNVETVAFTHIKWEWTYQDQVQSMTAVSGAGTTITCIAADTLTLTARDEVISRVWVSEWEPPTAEHPTTPEQPPRPVYTVYAPVIR